LIVTPPALSLPLCQDVERIYQYCASMEYFRRLSLTEAELRELATELTTSSFAAGGVPIFTERSPCDGFYVMLIGYATVRKETPDGVMPFKELRSVGPREVFGYDEVKDTWDRAVRPNSAVTNCRASVRHGAAAWTPHQHAL
jgi:hypothetical protein